MEAWINNRKIKCITSYDDPVERTQRKGLPQGAILSPILHNIYTAEVAVGVKGEHIRVLQYADDIIFYTSSNAVQSNIEEWKKQETN